MARQKKASKKTSKKMAASAVAGKHYNRAAQWKAYRELQMRADKAWGKLRDDVRKNARSDIILRDNNYLRLLLGECNYMALECMRIASKGKARRG